MSKKIQKRISKQQKKNRISPFNIYWDKKNYLTLLAGLAILVIGFFVMSSGNWNSTSALVFSPVILGIAYLIIFPLSIFSKKNNTQENNGTEQVDPGKS